jgi:hypothetical protein
MKQKEIMFRSASRLSVIMSILVALLAGCYDQSTLTRPTETVSIPIVKATSSLTAPDASIEMQVPYSKTSIWNTPIGPSPKYDVHSVEMVATLKLSNEGRIVAAGEGFNHPVYYSDETTPRWDIPCMINECTIATSDQDIKRTNKVMGVPIPLNAKPGADSDGRMIIIDTVTHTEYDISKAQRTATGWSAGTVSVYNILWDGTPVGHSSRGSGIPAMAGLLRPWEIRQGRIEHALAFGYTETAKRCVFPASKSDGGSKQPFAIPEGARLQLDPSLTEVDFDHMGLNPSAKIIARALQEYGMILVDTSGSFKMYLEDLINNPFAIEQWTDPELNLTKESIYNIPYTSFRVLELPPDYWELSENATYHGKCVTFQITP